MKRELEQGSLRCTEAWHGKIDALKALKPEDNSVKYMGFVQDTPSDPNSRQALFYVEAGKKESANPSDKPYRLLKLSDLPESSECCLSLCPAYRERCANSLTRCLFGGWCRGSGSFDVSVVTDCIRSGSGS